MDNGFKTDLAMRRFVRELFDGEKDDKDVFVISGAPGSGKSTHVRQNKKNGDLVVDLDLLASALQGDSMAHPDYMPVMDAVMAAREAIYQTIEARNGKWKRAFVITSSPDKEAVEGLANRFGAKVIQMQTSKNECIDRIRTDPARTNVDRDVELVEKWFAGQL